MTAVRKALYIEQGATFTLGFNWYTAGTPIDGVPQQGDPYDLTGWLARMQLRKTQQSPILLSASTTDGRITLGGTTGRVDIKFADEDTDALTTTSCLYDLELEDPQGNVYRLLEGGVTISPNITQETGDPALS